MLLKFKGAKIGVQLCFYLQIGAIVFWRGLYCDWWTVCTSHFCEVPMEKKLWMAKMAFHRRWRLQYWTPPLSTSPLKFVGRDLGPLHTRAKSRDYEIVRAQNKVSKGCPKTPPKSCSVKSYVPMPSTKCYLNECLFMWFLTHDKIDWINGCERLECHGLPVLRQACLQEVVVENSPSDHETWSIRCHVGTMQTLHPPCIHTLTPLVPQA